MNVYDSLTFVVTSEVMVGSLSRSSSMTAFSFDMVGSFFIAISIAF